MRVVKPREDVEVGGCQNFLTHTLRCKLQVRSAQLGTRALPGR